MDATNFYQNYKPEYSMAYKFGMALLTFFGIPTTILGIVANWGDIKGVILFCASLLFLCIRAAFYVDDKLSARKMKKLEREIQQYDFDQKKNKSKPNKDNY